MSLREARDELRGLVEEGETCPCCKQFAKVYRFGINSAISQGLISMYRKGGRDWVYVPDLKLPGGHMLKFRFWGIIEKPPELKRDDGSARVGVWRLTELGEAWVRCEATVPSHARIYNNRCLGLVGDPITIREALGKKFRYDELMAPDSPDLRLVA
jgi:hypothetical protein